MAAFNTIRSTNGLSAGRPSIFASAIAVLVNWHDARVTRRELSKLTAHELEDIGISYGDIEDIAKRGRS